MRREISDAAKDFRKPVVTNQCHVSTKSQDGYPMPYNISVPIGELFFISLFQRKRFSLIFLSLKI
jgi:hypothetical protein